MLKSLILSKFLKGFSQLKMLKKPKLEHFCEKKEKQEKNAEKTHFSFAIQKLTKLIARPVEFFWPSFD